MGNSHSYPFSGLIRGTSSFIVSSALGLLVGLLGAGCAGYGPGLEQGQAASTRLPHHVEIGLLSFLNDGEIASFQTLDVLCGLGSDSADLLVSHRDGPDGVPGTADDRPFESQAEVENVRRVGPWTIRRLVDCAEDLGYLGSPRDRQVLDLLNDQQRASLRLLHQGCALSPDQAIEILSHRDGRDGIPGTSDDDLFDDIQELSALSRVGSWALTQLRACGARAAGDQQYVTEETRTEVRDMGELDPALTTLLKGALLSFAQRRCEAVLSEALRFAEEVVIYAVDAVPLRYEALYVGAGENHEGSSARVVVTLDAQQIVLHTDCAN